VDSTRKSIAAGARIGHLERIGPNAWVNPASVLAAEAVVEMLDCRHGAMLAFRSDEVIGRSLRLYGEWSEHELYCLRPYIQAGTTVVDVGAHIGTHTLAFAKWVSAGEVIAVEPQPTVMCVLQVNCLLSGLKNVKVVNAACGKRRGDAIFNTFDPSNLGSTAFKVSGGFFNRIHRLLRSGASRPSSAVPVVCVDDLAKDRRISLIKIDAEGMEFDVLSGARKILGTHHPTIYCEQNDTRQLPAIHDLLIGFNYRLYWLETHQFNKANFRGEQDNIWWRTETGILALHQSLEPRNDLTEVDRDASKIPIGSNAREGVFVGEHDT
jgi:FkbM family methyltransferase